MTVRVRDKGYCPRASTPPICDSASDDSRDLETHPQDFVMGQLIATGIACRRQRWEQLLVSTVQLTLIRK